MGQPNLRKNFGYLADVDLDAACEKRNTDRPTGNIARNELYYELMTASGVKGAGNNKPAPQYVRAAARAVFDYEGTELIPEDHFDAYMTSEDIDVDEVNHALDLLLAQSE